MTKSRILTKESLIKYLILVLTASLLTVCQAGESEIVGDVRVQALSPTLVRIELKGPQGFEDRPTFHITERDWQGAAIERSSSGDYELLETSEYIVKVPSGADSLENIEITEPNGTVLWTEPTPAPTTIRCRWTGEQERYLYDEGDRVAYGPSPDNDSYYWILEYNDNGSVQIKNKATGDYMNLENQYNYVECTSVQPDWASKNWVLEDLGDGFHRIRCSWSEVPDYIHIENLRRYAEHDPAGTDNGDTTIDNWYSAMWELDTSSDDFYSNNRHWIPDPSENPQAWAIVDTPRYVPASSNEPWGGGYNVAPQGTPNNGWDLNNDSKDVYVFLPKGDGRQLRQDYITLTGRTDLVPLYAFGGWDSRFYAYTQQEALNKIDTYRSKDIPLDVFVVDTDWRVGASHGYQVNTDLFPDMEQFLSDAHNKNVRVMFNDHPEPQADALDYEEVLYRNNGLKGLFDIGLDIWWYDRNWHTEIIPPNGINKEVFGMYIYQWITQDYYPDRRPLIMSNVDGIDNGTMNRPPNIAAHRYPIQWTGDIHCYDESLRQEIRNAVYNGVYAPFAYTSADIGGFLGEPTTEQYCRWVQYGSMSPVFRLHCIVGQTRNPWDFEDPAEDVVRDYVQMRMRLLPVFYNAARNNYDTGEPILKRCDLNYPGYSEAEDNQQYLIGDDILAAPVTNSTIETVPSDWLSTNDSSTGLEGEYFANRTLSSSPVLVRTDAGIDFDWGHSSPAASLPGDNFSIRWTGSITVNSDNNVNLGIASDDGCRLWIDGNLIVDEWVDQQQIPHWSNAVFESGQTYSIKIEYYEAYDNAGCRLLFKPADKSKLVKDKELWVPPGSWTNVWTGNTVSGPELHTVSVSLTEMPIFVKQPAIIPLAPNMEYTDQKNWDPITLDLYPDSDQTATANLYEDDGITNAYQSGGYRNTTFEMSANDTEKTVSVTINPAQGDYTGALSERSWVLRLHKPDGWQDTPRRVTVDGVSVPFNTIARDPNSMPFSVTGGSPDGDVIEVQVPSGSVSMERTIEIYYYSPADYNQDLDIDFNDLKVMAGSWLKQPGEADYEPGANLSRDISDRVNFYDYAIFCQEWIGQ